MRKIFLFAFAALALSACKDSRTEEKAVLNDVIKIHDKVMGNDEQLIQNKMRLDTLLKEAKNTEAVTKIKQLISQANQADSLMENWMQKFDPDQKGKSHEEIMNYLSAQKKQVKLVDSLLKNAVNETSSYLQPFKK
ncbi:MAG: lipoprotein [Bacteroidota bacterium]